MLQAAFRCFGAFWNVRALRCRVMRGWNRALLDACLDQKAGTFTQNCLPTCFFKQAAEAPLLDTIRKAEHEIGC